MVKAAPDYEWTCPKCDRCNAAGVGRCSYCGVPAYYRADELRAQSAASHKSSLGALGLQQNKGSQVVHRAFRPWPVALAWVPIATFLMAHLAFLIQGQAGDSALFMSVGIGALAGSISLWRLPENIYIRVVAIVMYVCTFAFGLMYCILISSFLMGLVKIGQI